MNIATKPSKARFFSSLKVGTRIIGGFSVVLMLTVVLSIVSIFGIRGLVGNFESYAHVSKQTINGALIDGNVNDIRQSVERYLKTGKKSTADKINKHYDEVMSNITATLAITHRADWREMLKETQENLRAYGKHFKHLVELRTNYESAAARMGDAAKKADAALKKVDKAADETKNAETSNQTMELIEDFLRAQGAALNYRAQPNEKYAKAFEASMKVMEQPHISVQNSGFQKVAQLEGAAYAAVLDYQNATEELMSVAADIEKMTTGPMQALAVRIDEVGEKLRAAQNRSNTQILAQSQTETAQIQLIVIGFAIGGLVLGFAFSWLTGRMISKPLVMLVRPIEELAGGNFAVEMPSTDRKDEVGQIAAAIQEVVDKVGMTVSNIKTAANEVTNATAEISTSTTDLSQRTEEQAASLEETSASMEEISATVKKNADNARQANEFASETNAVAERGGAVVSEAVSAMARIEESSRKISDIIGVIDEIARQTNLLALNAAVEAARAGEAGRGFAVVASEVRTLAQRSSQAAKDIKDLIMNSGSQVKDGVELVNKAGQSLNEIVASIQKVAAIVGDITNASIEQSAGVDQINKALAQMDEVTQQNSALVEENAATAKTLEHQARMMDEQVAYFRIGNRDEMLKVAGNMGSAGKPEARLAANASTGSHRADIVKASAAPKPAEPVLANHAAPRRSGGPVGEMHTALAVAVNEDPNWKEF